MGKLDGSYSARTHRFIGGGCKKAILHFFCKKETNLFNWVEWIVKDLRPFNFCEKALVRKYTRLQPISVETLMKGLLKLTMRVEQKIKESLPDVFALVFDGWSSHGTHFLTIFATWPDIQQASGYSQAMLSFATLPDEEHLDAQSHKESMHGILQFNGKDYSNVACIIGDNSSTNRSLVKMSNLFFVGCASHRLNLGVKTILSSYSLLIDRFISCMCFLRTIKGRAAHRKHTNLSPLLCNATSWSSTREMVCRYFELLKIELVSNIVPDDLQLSPAENRSGNSLLKILDDLNTITKTFQDEDLHMFMIRDYLDCEISVYSELEQHCEPTSQIVEDQEFESAVVKIRQWQQGGEVFA